MRLRNFWFLIAVTACLVPFANARLKTGETFPTLTDYKLDGSLPDTKNKIVLVDFWASWCGPCKQSFPSLDELQKKYGAKGLVIIAVSEDENKSDMDDFLKQHPVSFTTVREAGANGKKLVEKIDISTVPSSFLIDKAGKVRFTHSGYQGNRTKEEYTQEIETLLKE
jgi:thiol-disulfide isomerase/thioredoxin